MTFSELKKNLDYLLAGDTAMRKDNDALLAHYKRAIDTITRECEPLSLITCDRERFTPLRSLDDLYFIRKPETPVNDDDALDIDDGLADAALNLMASYMVRNQPDGQRKKQFEHDAAVVMDSYTSESLEYIQSMGFYKIPYRGRGYNPSWQRDDIAPRLDEAGLLKYYTPYRTTGTPGWAYAWDMPTVDKIDIFMLRDDTVLTPSEKALWEQFSAWADGEDDPETSALMALDGIYLSRV